VAFSARHQPPAAELFEAFVKFLSGATEIRVVAVAQPQYGVLEMREFGRGGRVQMPPKGGGIVRRVPVAPGAGDDHHTRSLGKFRPFVVVQREEARVKSMLLRLAGESPGQ